MTLTSRFIHLEPSTIPFGTPEPCSDELLPVNDDDWEDGKVVPSEALYTTSFSSITTVGLFARSCQAAHMLSKVIQHKNMKKHTQDATSVIQEAKGLHHALCALQSSIEDAQLEGASSDFQSAAQAAFAVCVCARYLLYSLYACNENDGVTARAPNVLETEMQGLSLDGIKFLASSAVPKMALASPECPLLAHCLYLTATECAWFVREDHKPEMRAALAQVVQGLGQIGKHWVVGGELRPELQSTNCPG